MGTRNIVSARPLPLPNSRLYQQDFAAWASQTARLLREGRFADLDIESLAEEVEDMARSDKRELLSRLFVLIVHLLKWAQQPQRRSGSWESTIITQRLELENLLEQSPGLRPAVAEAIAKVYSSAVARAKAETRLSRRAFPEYCPFSPNQILDNSFFPDGKA